MGLAASEPTGSSISTPAPSKCANALNLFRQTKDGTLDKKYLRVCSVYRLLKKQIIGQARALELLAQRHSTAEMKTLHATVGLWRAHPIKEMLP